MMDMRALILALAVTLVVTGVRAETVEECRTSYAAADAILSIVAMPRDVPADVRFEEGHCAATDLASDPIRRGAPELRYRRVLWSGDPAGIFTVSVEVEPGGSRLPGTAAARDLAQIEVVSRRNAKTTELIYAAEFTGRNNIAIVIEASGIDTGTPGRFRASLVGMAVFRASMEFESDGRLGTFLDATFGPRNQISVRDRERTGEWLTALPQAVMTRASRDAAIRLLAAQPEPRGHGRLDLAAPSGIRPLGLVALMASKPGPATLASALADVTLAVTFRP
jgi:hypothetical protein